MLVITIPDDNKHHFYYFMPATGSRDAGDVVAAQWE